MLGDLDALYTTWMASLVLRMVNHIVWFRPFFFHTIPAGRTFGKSVAMNSANF
jgi:hypothetical protein